MNTKFSKCVLHVCPNFFFIARKRNVRSCTYVACAVITIYLLAKEERRVAPLKTPFEYQACHSHVGYAAAHHFCMHMLFDEVSMHCGSMRPPRFIEMNQGLRNTSSPRLFRGVSVLVDCWKSHGNPAHLLYGLNQAVTVRSILHTDVHQVVLRGCWIAQSRSGFSGLFRAGFAALFPKALLFESEPTEQLIYCFEVLYFAVEYKISTEAVMLVRKLANVPAQKPRSCDDIAIFRRTEGSALRSICNEAELVNALSESKFKVTVISNNAHDSLALQVRRFAMFPILVTPHGSHITITMLSHNPKYIIEVSPTYYHDFGGTLARIRNASHVFSVGHIPTVKNCDKAQALHATDFSFACAAYLARSRNLGMDHARCTDKRLIQSNLFINVSHVVRVAKIARDACFRNAPVDMADHLETHDIQTLRKTSWYSPPWELAALALNRSRISSGVFDACLKTVPRDQLHIMANCRVLFDRSAAEAEVARGAVLSEQLRTFYLHPNMQRSCCGMVAKPFLIGVGTGAVSRKNDCKLSEQPIFRLFFPSLARTLDSRFEYVVAVGIDDDDPCFSQYPDVLLQAAVVSFDINVRISVHFLRIRNPARKPGPIFNYVMQFLNCEGAQFLCRVNDDTEFTNPVNSSARSWSARFSNVLKSLDFVGVVGPRSLDGNKKILVHDFVHRSHMCIFSQYYPTELTDWFLDDWITMVYGDRTVTDSAVKFRHHLSPRRYEALGRLAALSALVHNGQVRVRSFLQGRVTRANNSEV